VEDVAISGLGSLERLLDGAAEGERAEGGATDRVDLRRLSGNDFAR
jgi:hypothetical protein